MKLKIFDVRKKYINKYFIYYFKIKKIFKKYLKNLI